jgi:hypothetical protein
MKARLLLCIGIITVAAAGLYAQYPDSCPLLKNKIGFGSGIVYGGAGIRFEGVFRQRAGVVVCAGNLDGALDILGGLEYYFREPLEVFRFRAGLLYGTVYSKKIGQAASHIHKTINGICPFIGTQMCINSNFSLELDLGYRVLLKHELTSEGRRITVNDKDGIMPSMGFAFHF